MPPATACSSARETDDHLRDALRRCPAPTLEAAIAYWRTGDSRFLPTIVQGLVWRFVEPDLRPRLQDPADELRLHEDLGMDSLTMLEVVLLAEDVLRISISGDELRHLQTLGQVKAFMTEKVTGQLPPADHNPL